MRVEELVEQHANRFVELDEPAQRGIQLPLGGLVVPLVRQVFIMLSLVAVALWVPSNPAPRRASHREVWEKRENGQVAVFEPGQGLALFSSTLMAHEFVSLRSHEDIRDEVASSASMCGGHILDDDGWAFREA